MSTQITEAFKRQYASSFEQVYQRTSSELENAVRREAQEAEFKFWDFVGKGTVITDPGRHAETEYSNTPHTRRRNTQHTKQWADLIDDDDKIQALIDPTSDYLKSGVAALQREKDLMIIDAMGATSYTGKDGSTSVNVYDAGESRLLRSDDTIEAAGSNFTDATATGLTLKKIAILGKLLSAGDVPMADRHLVCNYDNMYYLLGSTKATSADYAGVKALVRGEIDTYMGFMFHWLTDDYFTDNTTDTECIACYAWHKPAVLLTAAKDIETKVDSLPTRNYSTQVFAKMRMGSTRLQGPGLVQFLCKKTPTIDFTQS